jgi:hypothetical protein
MAGPRDKLAAPLEAAQGTTFYEVVKSTFHKIAATAAE